MRPQICNYLPVPELMQAKSILFIQPHPDDLEIGAGATIARLTGKGIPVSCLTVTDGSAGTYDPNVNSDLLSKIRREETVKSSALLGVHELLWLDFPDGGVLPYEEVRAEITKTIRQAKPQAVMVCDPWLPYEVHSDHIRTGMAAAEAAYLANMPNFCPVDLQEGIQPHSVDMLAFYYTAYPNTFIEAGEYWNLKFEAIGCHESQFPPDKMNQLKAFLEAKAADYSKQSGRDISTPVEAFKVLTPSHLHIFEEAWRC